MTTRPTTRMRILHVEDDANHARIAHRALVGGAPKDIVEVSRVETLEAALERLGKDDFDVVLLDLGLPDASGIETIDRVRRARPGMPIVALSGSIDEVRSLSAVSEGAQDYVSKGEMHLPGLLLRTLRYAIERQKMTATLERRAQDLALELTRTEAQFRQLIDGSADGLMVTDQDGTVRYLNPAAERLLGRTADQVVIVGHPWRRPARATEPLELTGADGTVRHVEVRTAATTWRGAEATLVTLRDVTRERAAEEDARRREEQLRLFTDAAPVLVAYVDREERFRFNNRRHEEWFGRPLAEIAGRTLREVLGNEAYAAARDGVAAALAGRTSGWRYTRTFTDGRVHHLSTSAVPDVTPNGAVRGFVAATTDVTELVALQAQLLQAQKMEAVGRLAGGVAHDFNNLLTAIGGYAELVKAQLVEGDPLRDDVAEILLAAQRAGGLTRQLLAFGRRQVMQPRVLDLTTVLEGMHKLLARLIGEDVQVMHEIAPGLGRVHADPGQIEQVIMNLAVNARDAMPRGGRLTFRLRNTPPRASGEPASVQLEVQDTGHGMDEATLARIFEPFFTTKEEGRGTGLGLSTVFGIVEQHRGQIRVDSAPGRGTTFRIDLPCVTTASDPAPDSQRASARTHGRETILLVEDEEALRTLASRLLRARGYTILVAGSGAEALLIAERHEGPIDLLLSDIVMPLMSGIELERRLAVSHPEMRVLLMSGYSADVLGSHDTVATNLPLLTKPFSPDALADAVRHALGAPKQLRTD